ncbi:restriction endonuclease [Meiothermus ruber]|uniref:restriction endonuclease n=1 Tax=Meiothermus ruber TaxID=277 RepID=UPI00055F47D1|nr:restriction endonuclease [Meiothermus ruber]
MEHEPLFEPDPDITKRLEKLDGEGLELYVADLLSTFRPLGWKVYVTKRSRDFGGDLVLDNPDGIRYVIQAKHRQDDEKVIGLSAVQQAVAAKAAYGAHHSIAMSNAVDFSEPAKRLAAYNKTILWTKHELQKLYFASIYRDEKLLQEIGLELGKPASLPKPQSTFELVPHIPSPESVFASQLGQQAEQKTLPLEVRPRFTSDAPKSKSRFLFWAPAFLVALLAAIAIFGLKRVWVASEQPSPEDVVIGYDRAYRHALNTNDTSQLFEYAAQELISARVQPWIDRRARRGCILFTVEKEPMRVLGIDVRGDVATATVRKSWKQTLVCPGQQDQVKTDGPFEMRYVLKKSDGWKIVESGGN